MIILMYAFNINYLEGLASHLVSAAAKVQQFKILNKYKVSFPCFFFNDLAFNRKHVADRE